jgi:uncharacterized protein (DUF885 family)
MRTTIVARLWFLAITACATPTVWAATGDEFRALLAEHWQSELREAPMLATDTGDKRYNDQLERVRPQDVTRRAQLSAEYLRRLRAIDRSNLSARERAYYSYLERQLEIRSAMGSQRGFLLPRLLPINYHQTFVEFAHRVKLLDERDYRDYIGRLGAFATQMDDFTLLLQTGLREGYRQPCNVLEQFVAGIRAARSANARDTGYFAPLRNMPAGIDASNAISLQSAAVVAIEKQIFPALDRLLAFAGGRYLAECRKSIALSEVPGGRDWYALLARHYTTTDMPVREIYALGEREVARIKAEMQKVIDETDFKGDFAQFVQFLRTDARFYSSSEADYLARAASIAKSVDRVLPLYFRSSLLPRMPFGIEPIPAELAPSMPATNYYPPSEGEHKAGIYYLNTHDLKSRPLYDLPGLTLHNAMPGHHLQITLQQEMPDLPPQIRYGDMVAYTEGWSLYAEWLGHEMGLYQDPYSRFGQLSMEMWRALRLVVDPGIHLHGWTRQRAVDYMAAHSALSLASIESEVDRYISWPAQALAYKVGDLKMRELRERAQSKLGARFDIRSFHAVLLQTGSVPLDVLERTVDDWLATVTTDSVH